MQRTTMCHWPFYSYLSYDKKKKRKDFSQNMKVRYGIKKVTENLKNKEKFGLMIHYTWAEIRLVFDY